MSPRLATPCLILSDAHLGAASSDSERSLIALLEYAKREARSLVINGDLFDFWFEWRHVMPRVGYRTVAALSALRDSGIEVVWIAGNHDCWGGDLLTEDAGLTYHLGPWRGEIGSWQTVIEHGDGLRGAEDAPYRRLRAVLRNRMAIWMYRHLLHPDWATAIARRSSHTSRNMRPRDGGEGLRQVARGRLRADPTIDLYVFGHTHTAELEQDTAGAVFANPGAWMDGANALLVSDDGVALTEWDGTTTRTVKSISLRRGAPPR